MSNSQRTYSKLSRSKQALLQRMVAGKAKDNEMVSNAENGTFELSFAQQRLWFIEQLLPSTALFNIPYAVKIHGAIDLAALQQSLDEIVRRHPAFRTQFILDGQTPSQQVLENVSLNCQTLDFQAKQLSGDDLMTAVNTLAAQVISTNQAPMAAAYFIRIDENTGVFVLIINHLIADGWSMGVFARELLYYYEYYLGLHHEKLPPNRLHYTDYSQWQARQSQSKSYQKQLAYWENQLDRDTPRLQLPYDRDYPLNRTYEGQRQYIVVPSSLTAALKQFANEQRVTLYALILSAFKVLLHAYSQADVVTIGCPVANRNRQDIENIIGFFVNTLTIKTELNSDMLFVDYLHSVKQTLSDAYDNQDVPFELVVKKLTPERDGTLSPLFNTGFVFHNTPKSIQKPDAVKVENLTVFNGKSQLDLMLSLTEIDGQLQGFLEYSTELFNPETIDNITRCFMNVLRQIEDPHASIADLLLPGDDEYQQCLEHALPKQQIDVKETITKQFETIAARLPKQMALKENEHEYSYEALNQAANRLARYLAQKIPEQVTYVGICLERSYEFVISVIALIKLGKAYVPFDTRWPNDRVKAIAHDMDLTCLITSTEHQPNVSCDCIQIDKLKDIIADYSSKNLSVNATSVDPMYVIYTSGSSGKPKGVIVSHENLSRLFVVTREHFEFSQTDRWSWFHSCAFDFSVWEMWGALLHGATLVTVPYDLSCLPDEFAQLINSESITILSQTPSAFSQLLGVMGEHNLKSIVFGGERFDDKLAQQWHAKQKHANTQLINMYGITETTVHVTYRKVMPSNYRFEQSTIGKPLADLGTYIVNAHNQMLGYGLPGEIVVCGAGVSQGYHNRDELNDDKFFEMPDVNLPAYRTGDLARIDANGELIYLGRNDAQVKIRGYRIECGEIESKLKAHPAVEQAFVVKKQINQDESLIAYIVEAGASETGDWHAVFDNVYQDSFSQYPEGFNISGWDSLYDGKPIAADIMQQWLDNTLRQIDALNPESLFEVGFGTGMILHHVKDQVTTYHGVEPSQPAYHALNQRFKHHHICLQQKYAHELEHVDDKAYDTVVINSVIQYFSSLTYLQSVLQHVFRIVKADGQVFIGDVRNNDLIDELESEVYARKGVKEHADHELLISPYFFEGLKNHFAQIANVQIRLKQGMSENELSCFRYDVNIVVGKQKLIEPHHMPYESIQSIQQALALKAHAAIIVQNIPNSRLAKWSHIDNTPDIEMIEDLLSGKTYELLIPQSGNPYFYDLLLCHTVENPALVVTSIDSAGTQHRLANTPVNHSSQIPEIRQYLETQLPGYMMPAYFMAINDVPLTVNGKLDITRLPTPSEVRNLSSKGYVPAKTDVEKALVELWQTLLNKRPIGIQDNFFELGGHSLLAAKMIINIKSQYHKKIPLKTLFKQPTIAWLASLISQEVIKEDDLALFLNDSHIKFIPNTIPHSQPSKTTLLTGASGFLGAFLLQALIEETDHQVICLVRAKNTADARIRVLDNLTKYQLVIPDLDKRVSFVAGDIAKPMLGLSYEQYHKLEIDVDDIIHNASLVNFVAPYAEHVPANVMGTKNIIQLAMTGREKSIQAISTTHVFSSADAVGHFVDETSQPMHPHRLHSGYTQSKWVAESLIANARAQGLKAKVYRLGRIWGHSEHGACQENDFLWIVLDACLRLQMIPRLDTTIDALCADQVSRMILELANDSTMDTAHLINPEPVHWDTLISIFRELGYRLESIAYDDWFSRVQHHCHLHPEDPISRILPLLDQSFDNQNETFDIQCKNTYARIKSYKTSDLSLDKNKVQQFIHYFEKEKLSC